MLDQRLCGAVDPTGVECLAIVDQVQEADRVVTLRLGGDDRAPGRRRMRRRATMRRQRPLGDRLRLSERDADGCQS